MTAPHLKLFVAPGSCARVPTIALEEIGVPYETQLIRLAAGDQKTAEFLAVNPKGKVPALLIDGEPLTENTAILTWLHLKFPQARLLPETTSDLEFARQVADIAAFSGTFHPIVTRFAMSKRFVEPGAPVDGVRKMAVEAMAPLMSMVDDRLSARPWWYGDTWSIADAYLFWVWWRLTVVGYDGTPYPNIASHARRISERPSVARAMAAEQINADIMKAEGLYVPNP